jgi:hypothetical protein
MDEYIHALYHAWAQEEDLDNAINLEIEELRFSAMTFTLTFKSTIEDVNSAYALLEMESASSTHKGSSKGFFITPHDIVDFSDEIDNGSVLVHLQSRPFSFGYQYSHVHRIVDMVRASLSGKDNLTAALYGSDDLQNWRLLTYVNRKNVTLSQLRTGPSARSWRYYTICIGGKAPVDTDFGPVLIDADPVIRRIG